MNKRMKIARGPVVRLDSFACGNVSLFSFKSIVLKRLINYEKIISMLSNNTFVKEQECFFVVKLFIL